MSSSTFVGNSDGGVTGLCPAPPPPPPPPPVPGQVPAVRINTVEAPAVKRPQINNGAYEPPAAIQNAMLTKDKKPFTYTPGMGGKLDLSQIRSPRMARRVAKNANDEGIEGPPKSALEPKPTQAPNPGANLFIQPQVAVPVFPTNIPPPPSVRTPPTPPVNRTPSNVSDKHAEPVKNVTKAETKVTPITVTSVQSSPSESPSTPTQVTLTKAPTPWLQNKNKPQEELPEWAKRSSANKQSSSPDSPTSPPVYTQIQQAQEQPQWQQIQQKQQPVQPVQQRQQPQQYQYQQQQQPQLYQQQKRPYTATQQTSPQANQQERVIPIRIEDRPSVFDVKPEVGHHQFKQPPSPHHQQRWGQAPVQNQMQMQQQHVASPQPQQTTGGSYIVPIMIEGSDKRPASVSNNSYPQPTARNNVIENQTTKVTPQRGPPVQQGEPGPVQSRSFRVLQKITDTDAHNDVDPEQMRKLQLTEDDRMLMNKFKEQVDSDSFLHQEEDPRYRGAAIPSRAFRFLQTMTESGETPVPSTKPTFTAPRVPTAINKKQNRNSKTFEETQANLPPSEQQVQEPKKYMGSAIPSRSFRILQAMTAPESVATQENRQADYTCQTENNAPGNQQGVYFPPCPPPFWNPETGWWGYCPLPYPGVSDTNNQQLDTYPYQNDGTAYICYPIYNQNYPNYPQCNPTNEEQNIYGNMYPQYVYDPAQNNQNICNGAFGQINVNDTLCNNDQTPDILNNRLQEVGNKITNDTNDLNVTSQWDRSNLISRAGSSNSNKDSDCTTAMNITDEEEIPENVVTPGTEGSIHDSTDKKACSTTELNVPVPNYTYMDTSDSSDSTDSESQSDNESITESSKSNASNKNAVSDNTSSDSDDSESYLAYSTGLNPQGRQEIDVDRNVSITPSSKETTEDVQETDSLSEKVNSTDCESDVEDQMENDTQSNTKKLQDDEIIPHKLSVIYEDTERAGSESPRSQSSKDFRRQNETDFEATDDPPDETETPTVSVSLPLRFKFSVSENNEDVTTVIVGDSTIKPEPSNNKTSESRASQAQESCSKEKDKESSESYQVNNETTVDFTLKRQTSESKRRVKSYTNEKVREEVIESKTEKSEKIETPHVNFTLRKNRSRVSKINEETIETEFTIKSKKISTRIEEIKSEESLKECLVKTNTSIDVTEKSKETVERQVINNEDIMFDTTVDDTMNYSATVKVDQNTFETHDFNKNVVKPEVVVSECTWTEESSKISSDNLSDTNANSEIESNQMYGENNLDYSTKQRTEDDRNTDADDKLGKEPKHLLSVQNSREETDDEDSGVTSDMSRIISEVDTDSECTSSKNMKKYQRTQTHSRLFRLLNDDSIPPKHVERCADITSRREYLSLPLKTNSFNYDDNYCSNYSSGVTSPEYSPICEQSWRRLHDVENEKVRAEQNGDGFRYGPQILSHQERVSCKEDPYYQAWKAPKAPAPSDHDVVPSHAFKVLECKKPLWAYKVNVLCPRIRSTKNVPQTLQGNKTTDSSAPPIPTSYVNPKTEHC